MFRFKPVKTGKSAARVVSKAIIPVTGRYKFAIKKFKTGLSVNFTNH